MNLPIADLGLRASRFRYPSRGHRHRSGCEGFSLLRWESERTRRSRGLEVPAEWRVKRGPCPKLELAEGVGLPAAMPVCASRRWAGREASSCIQTQGLRQGFSSHPLHGRRGPPERRAGNDGSGRSIKFGGGGGIRTHGQLPDFGFQDRRDRPLCHPSGSHKNRRILCRSGHGARQKPEMTEATGGKRGGNSM